MSCSVCVWTRRSNLAGHGRPISNRHAGTSVTNTLSRRDTLELESKVRSDLGSQQNAFDSSAFGARSGRTNISLRNHSLCRTLNPSTEEVPP